MALGNLQEISLIGSAALIRNFYAYNGTSADLYPDSGIIELSNGVLFNLGNAADYFGRVICIKNVDVALTSTIDPQSTQTIDGQATYTLEVDETIFITPNDAFDGWNIISRHFKYGFSLNSLSDVSASSPITGQVLKWNGFAWVNDTDATGGASAIPYSTSSITILTETGLQQIKTLKLTTTQRLTIEGTGRLNIS